MNLIDDYLRDFQEEFDSQEDDKELKSELEIIYSIWDDYLRSSNNPEELEWGKMDGDMNSNSLLVPYQNYKTDVNNKKIPLLTSMRNIDTAAQAMVISKE